MEKTGWREAPYPHTLVLIKEEAGRQTVVRSNDEAVQGGAGDHSSLPYVCLLKPTGPQVQEALSQEHHLLPLKEEACVTGKEHPQGTC